MKRGLIFAAATVSAAFAFAGGVENKTNMSTGYLRNPSRNAETQRPEAAFYNIAGTAFMKDGLWIEGGNQFVFKEYKHEEIDGTSTSYSDNTTVWLYPNLDVVYHKNNFAAFANFGVYAGGGSLNYDDGSAALAGQMLNGGLTAAAANHKLKVDSITYGGEVGGAYKFLDGMVSAGAAFRMVYGTQSMEISSDSLKLAGNGGDKISYDADAIGFGGAFGIHLRPIEKLDVSVQYSTINKIEYELDNVKGNLAAGFELKDGKKFNTDLPATLSFGASYSVIDPLLLSFSCNYYFNKQSSMDSALGKTDYDNSIEFAVGADYKINDMFAVGLGCAYSKQGTNDEANNIFAPVLDSFLVSGGVEYTPVENLTITAAGMWVDYFDEEYANLNLSKDLVMASIGVTYRLPF